MAKSFLDRSGLPLGLRNNNPGNLRPLSGGQQWQGEIVPDYVHNFSRFSDIGYGLRAMITDLLGDIRNDGLNTIRKLISAYAPASDNNNTIAYINAVSSYAGISPDAAIPMTDIFITKLVKAQLNVELGGSSSLITEADIKAAFPLLSSNVKSWIVISSFSAITLGLLAFAAYILIKKP